MGRPRAMVISICNLMTKYGETTGFTASEHLRVLHQHLGSRKVDVLIVNSSKPNEESISKYKEENSIPVEYKVESIRQMGVKRIIESNVMSQHSLIRHDPMKVAWEVFKTIQEHELEIHSKPISTPPEIRR